MPTAAEGTGRRVAEMGVAVALSYVLALFAIPVGFAGGQASLDMVPILVLARVRGAGPGCLAGACFGLLHLVQEPITVHPVQVLLDYPVAFGALGLAGLVPGSRSAGDFLGILAGVLGRYAVHVLSGVVFLGYFVPQGVPGSPLAWSLGYNATYMIPSGILALILVPALARALRRR